LSYSQRDILLIPVPFTDLTSSKRRPVLVISSDAHNNVSQDIIVAAITSNISSSFSDVTIDNSYLEYGSLPRLSIIRPDKLYTLSQAIVVHSFGRLSVARFNDFLTELDNVLGR
jgi:mRNA interferase MazF